MTTSDVPIKIHVAKADKVISLIDIELPYPPPELNPNKANHLHWTRTAPLRAQYKSDCYYVTKERIGTGKVLLPHGDFPLQIMFVYPSQRPDCDNVMAAIKPGLDGFAAALKIDDGYFEPLVIQRVQTGMSGYDRPGVIIRLPMRKE